MSFVYADILGDDNNNIQNKLSSSEIRNTINKYTSLETIGNLYNMFNSLMHEINNEIPQEEVDYNFTLIRDYYSQNWRRYHNLNHVLDFLNKFNYCLRIPEINKVVDKINTQLAIIFHDIIYTPSRNDNEERSNEEFDKFYLKIKKYDINEKINSIKVNEYIIATKFHFKETFHSDDFNLNLLMDIDISGMAGDDHIINGNNICYEFSHHLTSFEVTFARCNFLKSTINKKLFKTPVFSHLEKQALENNLNLIKECEEKLELLNNK